MKKTKGMKRKTDFELDRMINGILWEGQRYPLCYHFWRKDRWRPVRITLTGELGTLIGESIIIRLTQNFTDSIRGIVRIDGCERITDLDYSVIQFM